MPIKATVPLLLLSALSAPLALAGDADIRIHYRNEFTQACTKIANARPGYGGRFGLGALQCQCTNQRRNIDHRPYGSGELKNFSCDPVQPAQNPGGSAVGAAS